MPRVSVDVDTFDPFGRTEGEAIGPNVDRGHFCSLTTYNTSIVIRSVPSTL